MLRAVEGNFASELKGGTIQDFYQGVTGLCGEPDVDLAAGMRREHRVRSRPVCAGSTASAPTRTSRFRRPTVALRRRRGQSLSLCGGSGCEKAEGVDEGVVVKGRRGCFRASGLKWVNIGETDPDKTSRFLPVARRGRHQPTEGRGRANAKLVAALARKVVNRIRFQWAAVPRETGR